MGIIIKPLVTEKMTAITDKLNRFGFVVRPEANKLEIKKEIEALYNVTVVDVNTVKYAGKNKSRYTQLYGSPAHRALSCRWAQSRPRRFVPAACTDIGRRPRQIRPAA